MVAGSADAFTWPDSADAHAWEATRLGLFPTERLNLNPGTLGTCAAPVRRAVEAFRAETDGYPLGQYVAGREALRRARAAATAIWGEAPAICGPTTQTMNQLALLLPRALGKPRLRVLTTLHEHHGGVGGFEHDAAYSVAYLTAAELADPRALTDRVRAEAPDVLFVSQRAWTDNAALPVDALLAAAEAHAPACLRVVDAAQAVGIESPALDPRADLVVASAHKWLFGPAGTGFAWVRPRAVERLGAVWRAGEPLDPDSPLCRWEAAGGQDFAAYAGVEAALALYAAAGPARVAARAHALAAWLAEALADALPGARVDAAGAVVRLRAPGDPYPLYGALNARGVHTKCVKAELGGETLALLRLGVPWYESEARLGRAVALVRELGRA